MKPRDYHCEIADDRDRLRAEVERLTRERDCRDAIIDDNLRKIMHLENRIEEEAHRAEQLEADLKHVQGSDIGMMKLLHAEKLKTAAAERQVAMLREAQGIDFADAFKEAYADGRAKALEEAARVAELYDGGNGDDLLTVGIAKSIRALAKSPPK